jgi:hypothetical protein
MNESDLGSTFRLTGRPRWLDYGFAVILAALTPFAFFVYERVADKVLIIAADIGGCVYFLRAARSGVTIQSDGLTIREHWRTRRLAWRDIKSIDVRTIWAGLRTIAYVELTSGRQIAIRSLIGIPWYGQDNYKVVSAVRQLQQAFEKAGVSAKPRTGT